jgi:hypothetical protein
MRTLFIFLAVFLLVGLDSAGEDAVVAQTSADTTKAGTATATGMASSKPQQADTAEAKAAAASTEPQKPDTAKAEAAEGIAEKIA